MHLIRRALEKYAPNKDFNDQIMKRESGFLQFVKDNKICWIITVIATFFLHFTMLLGSEIGIDTEALIYFGKDFYQGWLNSGRYGLMLAKWLIFWGKFNPYVEGVFTIIALLLACILWTYLFETVSGKSAKAAGIVFSLILSSHTILTEQMYFRIQSTEIMLGFALIALSILVTYRGLTVNRGLSIREILRWGAVLAINLIAFSIYQSMIPLYIFCVVAVMYLQILYKDEVHPWLMSFKFAGVFIVSFIINEIITLSFFNGSSYLSNQISWGQKPIATCLYQIASHVARAGILGKRVYFAPTYAIYSALLLVITIIFLKNGKLMTVRGGKGKYLFPVVLVIFAIMSPFYMTVICGGEVVIRAQLVLPFAIAFMAYLLMASCREASELIRNNPQNKNREKLARVLIIAVIAVNAFTITEQSVGTLRLNHTDKVRYAQDEKLAYELISEIDKLQNADASVPVVFLGRIPTDFDAWSIDDGDVIGYSFFDWDTDPEPYSYHSSLRVIGFMSTLGTTYTEPDTARMQEAYEIGDTMTTYPEAGSIVNKDGMIIVKLSGRE